ncbi:hypothetical protein V3C99_009625, partial [Haemonchus contortus]
SMGPLWHGIILGCLALLAHFIINKFHSELPLHFGGYVDEGYEKLQKAFERNFRDGWESVGASFAVFVEGRKVVDLWGGYSDKQAAQPWKEDTLMITFSPTKAFAAVCVALLVDRGRLKYDDLVSKHWPEFAKNGKENITIDWVLSHMAGLPYLDMPITREMATDHKLMKEVLENETPKVPPGRGTGYHSFTYGWLVDQIIRKADEKHRGISQFLREEITAPNGIDFHVGLDASEKHRVARATQSTILEAIIDIWYDPGIAGLVRKFYFTDKDSIIAKAMGNLPWVDVMDMYTLNSPAQQTLEQATAISIGNARSMASIFSLFVNGRIVSEKTLALIEKPVVNETDYVINEIIARGHGFYYYPPRGKSEDNLMIGHPSLGCQQLMFDTRKKISFAYVTNGLKAGAYDLCRNYMRLQRTLYDVLKAQGI